MQFSKSLESNQGDVATQAVFTSQAFKTKGRIDAILHTDLPEARLVLRVRDSKVAKQIWIVPPRCHLYQFH